MSGTACNRFHWSYRRAAVLLATLALLLTACSGAVSSESEQAADNPAPREAATSEAASEPGGVSFCDAALDLFLLSSAAPGGEGAAEVLDTFESAAPAELEDHVANYLQEVRPQPVGEQPVALSSDESHMADDAIRVWLADNCGYPQSEVTGVKTGSGYAFEGMEDEVAAGPHDFSLTRDTGSLDDTDVPMEIGVLRPVDPDADLSELLKQPLAKLDPAFAAAVESRPQPENPDPLVEFLDFGYAHNFSGEEMAGHAFADLEPGTYAIVNTLYKNPDDPDTAYYLDGMYDVFEVQ